ncbi:uncharacterized protein STEHIDRAFT_149433 [Stereum hirsutum FP-91666 SS1]|uniref:uncharacterized protein n=1 Tax=Stereum hirsutum (strain FP-91666) TaxID=721885 RepID=UPI0004449C45|nr:uncharacterized protein STEHIDRAFT_149433 [Stereum hirsutum FP-91666 SS1]EIM82272.1 hypothetical protein STEHIDRAFT_149433 [Stereum hirsutum FP-91666 SS1]
MSSPFSLATVQAHPDRFIGPQAMGMFLGALEMGFLMSQLCRFLMRVEKESWSIRVIVALTVSLAIFQTVAVMWAFWDVFVMNFGDWENALTDTWVTTAQPVMTALLASPVQGFLIYRCWRLLQRKWYIIAGLGAFVVAYFIAAIKFTVSIIHIDFTQDLDTPADGTVPKIPIDSTYILTLTLPAILDVLLTGILLNFLLRSRHSAYSDRFQNVIFRLMMIAWEAAVPPCLCAIVALVTYVTLLEKNWWETMFQAVLGKLYVISLLATLNGRAELNKYHRRNGMPSITTIRSAHYDYSLPQFHNFAVNTKVADTPNGPDAFLSDSDPSELEAAGQSSLHYSHSHSRYNDDSSADPESLTMHSSTSNSNSKTKRKSGSIKSGSLISTDLSHSRRHPELGGERVRLDSIVDLDEEGDGGRGKDDTTKRRREEDEPLELAPVHLDSKDKVHTPGSGRFEVL